MLPWPHPAGKPFGHGGDRRARVQERHHRGPMSPEQRHIATRVFLLAATKLSLLACTLPLQLRLPTA